MKKRFCLILLIAISSCGKKAPNPTPTPLIPGKATLVFPASNALCTSGTILSSTQSAVVSSWVASANTTSYDLVIKNLLTGSVTTQSSTANLFTATLLKK